MAEVGVVAAPDGYTVNFHARTSLQTVILVVYSVTIFFATLFMILRLYMGAVIVRKFGLDIRESSEQPRLHATYTYKSFSMQL
jgi:hypothetical protein